VAEVALVAEVKVAELLESEVYMVAAVQEAVLNQAQQTQVTVVALVV
jgi:hypothetical protein